MEIVAIIFLITLCAILFVMYLTAHRSMQYYKNITNKMLSNETLVEEAIVIISEAFNISEDGLRDALSHMTKKGR